MTNLLDPPGRGLQVARPRLAMMAFFDMLAGINHWYRENQSLTIEEAAEGYVDLIVHQLLGARRVVAGGDATGTASPSGSRGTG